MSATLDDVLAGRALWCALPEDGFALARRLGAWSVDHCIGDPPYDEKTHEEARSLKDGGSDIEIDFAPLPPVSDFAPALIQAAKRWVICFCALEQLGTYSEGVPAENWIRAGLWIRTNGTPQISGDRPAQGGEGIAIMHLEGPKRWNRGGDRGAWTGPRDSDPTRIHPTKKPLWLMEALIRDFTDPGDLIFDPTMGEGTTGEACLRLGRRFIGCEIATGLDSKGRYDAKRDYFSAAVRRLERAAPKAKGEGKTVEMFAGEAESRRKVSA